MMRAILAAIVAAIAALIFAAPANAYLDRHQLNALQAVGPHVCQELDAQPNPLTMGR
jgi:hypothetical protein